MFKVMKSREGSALLVTVAILMILMVLGSALISVSLAEVRHGVLHEKNTQAHYVSVTGAEAAAAYIINRQKEAPVRSFISSLENGKVFPDDSLTGELASSNASFANGFFDVKITGQKGTLFIESTGTVGDRYQRTNTLVLSNEESNFFDNTYAIAAKTIIEAAGGAFTIDGNVLSNGPQALTESQLENVTGEAIFDASEQLPTVKYPFEEATITTGISPNEETHVIKATDLTQINDPYTGGETITAGSLYKVQSNAKGNAIDLGGNKELTFNTGSTHDVTFLHLEGSINQGGNSGITFNGSGKVYFYVDGSINFSGGTWNQTDFYGDVVFLVPKNPPDDDRTITFSGNTDYTASIIAPNVDMTYNGGGSNWFTGTVLANYFMGHGNFKIDGPSSSIDVSGFLSWPWSKLFWQR